MKIKLTIAIFAIAGGLQIQSALAADWTERTEFNPSAATFDSGELSFDLNGMYASRNRDNFRGDAVGAGVGVNYFFSRYLGVGADTYLDDFDYPNHLDASFMARYPLQQLSFAPYAVVGFGRQFHDVSQWTGHIGAGGEYRFNRKTGVFVEYRRVLPDQSKDFDLWRFGLRFRF